MTEEERHRAPALWLVPAGIAVALGTALVADAMVGLLALAGVLVAAAVARVVRRGRRPEGVAVRSVWQDAVVLLVLAGAIGALALTPGVSSQGTGGVTRQVSGPGGR